MSYDSSSTQSTELRAEATKLATRLGFSSPSLSGKLRAWLIQLALIALFGVWLPLTKGSDFLDSVILGSYACLGVVFAAPSAAVTFSGDRVPAFHAALARILVSVAYGLTLTSPMLLIGVFCVYATRTVVVGPDLVSLAACFLLGLALSIAVTSGVVWTTITFSATAGKSLARAVFVGLLLAFFRWSRWLPDVALAGAAIAAVVAGIILLLLKRQTMSPQVE
ncbi:MAG: hypothetical protein ABI824_08860 [Acidobacteriota bacterium]